VQRVPVDGSIRAMIAALPRTVGGIAAAALIVAATTVPGATDDFASANLRARLVQWLQYEARVVGAETGIEFLDQRVLDAMARVPRHEFVPAEFREYAYLDVPLPLGQGQNISQPFIIALMTHLARIRPDDVVFETGTGAGYHAAILALLAKRVYSVEYVETFVAPAAALLDRLGYDNVEIHAADGYYGWRQAAPFDVIIVKESLHHVPAPLLSQLKPGGRMVIPVGPRDREQFLTLIEKGADGTLTETRIMAVRFSPLQGGERI
jgi:protein-L-isoaspartate(D-aspartate) O-methyltransferase